MARLAADLLYGRSMRRSPVGEVARYQNFNNLLEQYRSGGAR